MDWKRNKKYMLKNIRPDKYKGKHKKDQWVQTYFYHILQLKTIIEDRIREDYPGTHVDLEYFIDFLYHTSSGDISPFVESIDIYPEYIQDVYFSYLINKEL